MKGFYFDYTIVGTETFTPAERTLRQNLQRKMSASEVMREIGERRGLCGITAQSRAQMQQQSKIPV